MTSRGSVTGRITHGIPNSIELESRAVSPAQRPTRLYTYYVTGWGEFPYDMLRWDSCWPVRQSDAAKLARSDKERSIQLHSYTVPTVTRWLSYRWRVNGELIT